ncbi:hypothetical protein HDU67_007248 [Dinochytrium kinnereticum]|nr:hypothetical protein HDU67_007248 [Dinochytrium kinnereticum]
MKFLSLTILLVAATASKAVAQNCNVKSMEYIVQGQEHRFGKDGNQVALNPAIVVQQICDQAPAGQCKTTCNQAGAALIASGARGFSGAADPQKDVLNAQAADTFNAANGKRTNIAAAFLAAAGGNGGGAAQPAAAGGVNAAGNCNTETMDYIVQGTQHRFGKDGRQVALNPAIVVQQICNRATQGQCKTTCEQAGAALIASGVTGFSGGADPQRDNLNARAADTFNAANGKRTNIAAAFPGGAAAPAVASLVGSIPPPPALNLAPAALVEDSATVDTVTVEAAVNMLEDVIALLDSDDEDATANAANMLEQVIALLNTV